MFKIYARFPNYSERQASIINVDPDLTQENAASAQDIYCYVTHPSSQFNLMYQRLGPEVIFFFSCSTQLSMKLDLLINFKPITIANSLAEHDNFSAIEYVNPNFFGIFIFISREKFMFS